jgi:putative ABC transport system ATP-binding protein
MSGGEQQRVAIARAVAKNPLLLLCDEPTGALDFKTGLLILSLLHKINRDFNKTVVIITHNAAIGEMADRVIKMRSGRIIEIKKNDNPIPPERIEW